jgi:moderate conductance mechanosensitive channel
MTAAGALHKVLVTMMTYLTHLDRGAALLNMALSVVVIVLAIVCSRLLRRWVVTRTRRLPGCGDAERHVRTRRIGKLFRWAADLTLTTGAVIAVAAIWGASGWLLDGSGVWLLGFVGRLAAVAFTTFAAFEAVTLAIHLLMARLIREADEPRRAAQLTTLSPLLRGIAQITILIIGALTFLSGAGVRIGPLLAGAGVAGIAVGFGAQSLVKDILTGIFLIAEDIVTVGDVVEIGGASGAVEQMTLRTIRLRDLDGTLHIFPYGEAQVVHNMTKTFAYSVSDLQIAYEADIDRAFELIGETGAELMHDPRFKERILEPIEILGVDSLGDSGVVLKARIKTKPLERWAVGREYNRRIKRAFDQAGIEIPYPHMKLVLSAAGCSQAPITG